MFAIGRIGRFVPNGSKTLRPNVAIQQGGREIEFCLAEEKDYLRRAGEHVLIQVNLADQFATVIEASHIAKVDELDEADWPKSPKLTDCGCPACR
jgi:hypothetical protein